MEIAMPMWHLPEENEVSR